MLIAVGTGGLANALRTGGVVARSTSGAILVYDAAGNAVGSVQGIYDASKNGINLTNGAQIFAGTLGLSANAAAIKQIADRNRLFAKSSEIGTTRLPAGVGRTDKFGNVEYSTLGSADDIALAKFHERVHSFLSPKLDVFRNTRADLRMAGYARSSFLRYLEEALAESYAQLRVYGISGLPDGISFPIRQGYVKIKAVVAEGAIGTIVVGGTTYGVYYVAKSAQQKNDQ